MPGTPLIHKPRWAIAAAFLILAVACAYYTFKNRYYFRFIPLPLGMADVVNTGTWFLPSKQTARANGQVDLGDHDLTTERGVRAVLDHLQEFSPTDNVNGIPDYSDITFDKWVREVKAKPFFCTDATQLFILAAWQQGLPAREWHLLPSGWPPGQGHSVVEFFNPKTNAWQIVDAQHGAIIRAKDGTPTNMVAVLRAYATHKPSDIVIDYGPHEDAMRGGARGPTVEDYFFGGTLLSTPVLQLRQASWFAQVPRKLGLSGHFVLGYPIIMGAWTHDRRVALSKLSVLFAGIFTILSVVLCVGYRRRTSANDSRG